MKVHVLKFGQKAVSGGCINFPVNVAEVCAKLPRTENDDGVILVHTGGFPGKPDGRWYSVNRENVLNAVNWLVNNNCLYSDVRVDTTCTCTAIGYSGHADTDEVGLEMGIVRMDYTIPNIEVDDILVGKENHHEVIHLGRVVAEPINLFTHPNAEEMAFPQLFPLGVNGFRAAREVRITALDYFQSRLLSADCRWRMNVPYCFWACNMVEQLRLQDQISIALRMRSSAQHSQCVDDIQLHSLTAGELKDGISENPQLSESCFAFMHNLRGTAAYWQRCKLEVFAMIRTLGPPTWFITLSADDLNWPDMLVLLANEAGMPHVSLANVHTLTAIERRKLVAGNPVTVARHFSHRFAMFVKNILKGSAKPIGEVVDFFWRIEFQMRGSPHVHSFWWVKDAPSTDTVEGLQAVPEFVDRFLSTQIPPEGSGCEELRSLVLRTQIHRHKDTCFKGGKRKCRFDFPRPITDVTRLRHNHDIGNRARFYVIKRAAGEEWVNAYNPQLLLSWKANIDVQMVGSVFGAVEYVVSYICKEETRKLMSLIDECLSELPQGASQRRRLSKIGNTMLTHRLLSAQEAAFRLCHLPLKGASRTTQYVSTERRSRRMRILRPRFQLQMLADSDTNVFQTGVYERYAARPSTAEFLNMSLAEFAVWYEYTGAPVNVSNPPKGHHQLQNGLGWVRKRTFSACLRVPHKTPEAHGDDYYYHLLLLYLPWRDEENDLLSGYPDAQSAFLGRHNELHYGDDTRYHQFANELQRTVLQLRELNRYGGDLYNGIAPSTLQTEMDAANEKPDIDPVLDPDAYGINADRLGDRAVDHRDGLPQSSSSQNECDAAIADEGMISAITRLTMSDREYELKVKSLNASQQKAFKLVVQYTRERVAHAQNPKHVNAAAPLRIFLTGGAGTGKSHLISVIREHVERAHTGLKHACLVVAPTGVAAFNIQGATLHRAFRLPVEHNEATEYKKLSCERLQELRRELKDVHVIIIDEVSMVSYQLFSFVHRRLMEIKGVEDDSIFFGGVSVIAVGDFYQLPPVRDSFLFQNGKDYVPGTTHLWRDLFQLIELEQNMRQKADASYARLLNHVRTGSHTYEDISMLQSRILSSDKLVKPPFSTALHLLPTVQQCNRHNNKCLDDVAVNSSVYEFIAKHSVVECGDLPPGVARSGEVPTQYIPRDDNDCAGLPHVLKLAVGAKVMLRRNIFCEDGLVNGARGIVVAFRWHYGGTSQAADGELPEAVLVKFDDPRVGRLTHVTALFGDCPVEAIEVKPITAQFHGKHSSVLERTQVPLILCWAATIHKVQGLSLDAAVIDLGPQVFEYGMAYVALSRVRTLDGVALLRLSPERVSASSFVSSEMERLRHQTHSGTNHCTSSVSHSKSSHQSPMSSRVLCVSKHKTLASAKQKCVHTSVWTQPRKGSKSGKKHHQSVHLHVNEVLQKAGLNRSKTLADCKKSAKQHCFATAKQIVPRRNVECSVQQMAGDSVMGQSLSTLPNTDVIYAGCEQCDPPSVVNRPLPGELWQREKISVLSQYSKMCVVDKLSSPDRLRPLQCDEISPHVRVRVLGDGNCLFRAVSRHVTGTECNHNAVRKATVKYLQQNPMLIEYLLIGVDAPLDPQKRKVFFNLKVREYLKNSQMAKSGEWGTDLEVFLLSSMLDVNIVVRQNYGQGRAWQCIGPTVDGINIVHNHALYLFNTRALDHYDCISSASVIVQICTSCTSCLIIANFFLCGSMQEV